MAETGVPVDPAVISGTALTDHNAHKHTFEVNYTCALVRTANLTLPAEATTVITFPSGSASEISDPLNWHSLSSNTERITVSLFGLYLVIFSCNIYVATAQNIDFQLRLRKNGASNIFVFEGRPGPAKNYVLSFPILANLSANDYVHFEIYYEGVAATLSLVGNNALFSATLLR